MLKKPCPVCEGGGRLFVQKRVGDLHIEKTVSCYCWACKGVGMVEVDLEDTDKDTNTIVPNGKS